MDNDGMWSGSQHIPIMPSSHDSLRHMLHASRHDITRDTLRDIISLSRASSEPSQSGDQCDI